MLDVQRSMLEVKFKDGQTRLLRSSGGRQKRLGLVALGQLAIGIILGLGQLSSGLLALGQGAIAAYLGIGQFVIGYAAIGQFAIGKYVLAQIGFGESVWSMGQADRQAIEFFKTLPVIRLFIP